MNETSKNGKRLRLWGGVLVFGAAALLRLLAPGRAEALRSLLLDRAGREAVVACVAFAEPEKDGWEDDGAISVFREDGPGNDGRPMTAPTCGNAPFLSLRASAHTGAAIRIPRPLLPIACCLLPVASSQAGDGGAAVCWEVAP